MMVVQFKHGSQEAWRWQSVKHALVMATAIFLSTILVVAFSTAVQRAASFVSHSMHL